MLHPACAYGVESHRRHWWLLSPPRYQFPRHQNRQRHSPYLVLYVYDWPAVLPSASWPRQCRTHLVMVPQTTPAAGSGRPHDVRKGVIRRHGGRLSRCSIQRVRMGLRATDGTGGCCRLPDTSSPATKTARGIPRTSYCMFMTGQLCFRQRRGPDSAGQAAE